MRGVMMLLLLLTACGVPQGDSPQAKCARQAQKDPAVVELYTGNSGLYMQSSAYQAELSVRERQAEDRCLRALGLAPPGGVESIRPAICTACLNP